MIPSLTAVSGIVFLVMSIFTLIMSIVRWEIFWVGLMIMGSALLLAFMEGVIVAARGVIVELIRLYRAKKSRDAKAISTAKEYLSDALGDCLAPFCFMLLVPCVVEHLFREIYKRINQWRVKRKNALLI